MEFPFSVNILFSDSITVWTAETFRQKAVARGHSIQDERAMVIDAMGSASAKAQKLLTVITTAPKLQSSDHRLYVMKDPEARGNGKIIGILKVGIKRLFLLDNSEQLKECSPLCVLDFYVHESCQRTGYGKQLFESMLKNEGVHPGKLAYDRPSPKLLGFLRKHYNLDHFRPQANSFVVFRSFFESGVPSGGMGIEVLRPITPISRRNFQPPALPPSYTNQGSNNRSWAIPEGSFAFGRNDRRPQRPDIPPTTYISTGPSPFSSTAATSSFSSTAAASTFSMTASLPSPAATTFSVAPQPMNQGFDEPSQPPLVRRSSLKSNLTQSLKVSSQKGRQPVSSLSYTLGNGPRLTDRPPSRQVTFSNDPEVFRISRGSSAASVQYARRPF